MRIAIDALGISRPGGGRSATLNLLEPLLDLDGDNEYLLFLDEPEPALWGAPGQVRQIVPPVAHRLAVRGWAQAVWPALLRRERVDLVHFAKNLATLWSPCASVATVHDLTVLVHPEMHPRTDVLYWRTYGQACLRRMDRVIAVSDLTAADVERYCCVPAKRIVVIREGIDERFRPAPADEVDAVRERYGLPPSYLLHVGSIWPKKNLVTLARAYVELVRSGGYGGALVLVGRAYRDGGDPRLEAFLRDHRDVGQVILTGPVPQEDLPALYTGAECFVFPSVHEGFGLVPLEAMACGAPVVATRVGALPETMGEDAVWVEDPYDHRALVDRLREVLTDTDLREGLVSAGLARAAVLSRRSAAERTLELYRRVAERRDRAT